MMLFQEIHQLEQTILMVTHSNIDASYAERVIFIKDEHVSHEIYRGEESQLAFQQRITDSLALVNGGSVNMKLRLLWHIVQRQFITQRLVIIPFILAVSVLFMIEYTLVSIGLNSYIKQKNDFLVPFIIIANFFMALLTLFLFSMQITL